MKGLEDQLNLILLVISNVIAILQLLAANKWPRIAKLTFFILFTWASITNWTISHQNPEVYLKYGELTWSVWYRDFIYGWFSKHIPLMVGVIATCQAIIAISMLLTGWIYKAGSIGAIIFLLAILPLGIGAGFPCTAIMAYALYTLLNKYKTAYIWKRPEVQIVPRRNPGLRA